MNCIICDKTADEVGSHLIPASLIKNCVGERDKEESYNIDSKNSNVSVYFGRANSKNTSTEIKPNDYARDYVLCKICEKKLGLLESKFATEFLQKFREDKYCNNFNSYISTQKYEIFEPRKVTNIEVQAYFYSIILRFCSVYKLEDDDSYIDEKDLLKIKKFVNSFLYDKNTEMGEIEDYRMLINFNKYSVKSKFIATNNQIKNPYIFYFCEAIVILFTKNLDEQETFLFEELTNSIKANSCKIIVGPEEFYDSFSKKIADILAEEFITNGVHFITKLNNKTYEENLIEVNNLIEKYKKENIKVYITEIFNELNKKYSS